MFVKAKAFDLLYLVFCRWAASDTHSWQTTYKHSRRPKHSRWSSCYSWLGWQ